MINPQNIHCLAINYPGVGISNVPPLYFVKAKSSLCYNFSKIKYPADIKKLWTEVELGIVVNENIYNISEVEADSYIEGFTVCADLTCSNIAGRDHHLAFSKSRKGFCPVNENITKTGLNSLKSAKLITEINGKITQVGCLDDMIFGPYKSLSYISSITELQKGDLLLTGTPAGVENNIIYKGDKIRHVIDNITELEYEIE